MKEKIRLIFIGLLPFLIFFAISFTVHIIASKSGNNFLIDGGDIDYPINVGLEVKRSFSIRSGEALGVPEFFPISKLFLILPQAIIQSVVGSVTLVNLIYFSLLLSLAGSFMYVLLKYLKIISLGIWMGSLFFMLNTFIYLRFQFPQPHLYYAYIALPLLVYVLVRSLDKSIKLYYGLGLFALIMMAISRTANMYLLYWALVPLIVISLYYMMLINIKIKIREIVLFFLLAIALNSVIFISYLGGKINYSELSTNSLLEYYRQDAIKFSRDYNIFETMSGFGSYAWTHQLSVVSPGEHNFPILTYFSRSAIFILAFVPILFLFIISLFNFRRKLPFILLFVLCGILANGYGWPFGDIYSRTVTNIPLYSDFFRDSWTYWSMPYFFFASVLLALAFNKHFKFSSLFKINSEDFISAFVRSQIIILLLILGILLYIIPGKKLNPAWVNPIPYGYQEMAEYLNKNVKGQKVLPLPLSNHIYGYTFYDWGYAGPDIMHRLADVNYIDKYYNQIATNKTVTMLDGILKPDSESLNEFLFRTQTNWILLRKDFIDIPGDGSKTRVNEFKTLLDNFDCWSIASEYGQLSLYKNTCNNHSSKEIQVTSKYIYGGNECMSGVPVDKYLPNSAVCGRVPKSDNFAIENNYLLINNTNNPEVISLKDSSLDLLKNYNFKDGTWNSKDLYTCDPEDPNFSDIRIVSNGVNNGIRIVSQKQKVCIFEPILNQNIGSGGVLKVKYKDNNQDIRYCVFGINDSHCYYLGTLGRNNSEDGIISKREISDGYTTDYVYIKDLGKFKDKGDMSLYLYFNDNKEENFSIDVVEARFVSMPVGFEKNIASEESLTKGTDLKVNIKDYIFASAITVDSSKKGNYVVSFNENKNSQWKLFGIKNNRIIKDFSNNSLTTYDYANGWYVENIQNYDSFVLVYVPQVIFITGLLITLWVYILYLIFWFGGIVLKKKKE